VAETTPSLQGRRLGEDQRVGKNERSRECHTKRLALFVLSGQRDAIFGNRVFEPGDQLFLTTPLFARPEMDRRELAYAQKPRDPIALRAKMWWPEHAFLDSE
jgi:hypothetical protein